MRLISVDIKTVTIFVIIVIIIMLITFVCVSNGSPQDPTKFVDITADLHQSDLMSPTDPHCHHVIWCHHHHQRNHRNHPGKSSSLSSEDVLGSLGRFCILQTPPAQFLPWLLLISPKTHLMHKDSLSLSSSFHHHHNYHFIIITVIIVIQEDTVILDQTEKSRGI